MTFNITIVGRGFVPLMRTANTIVDGYLGIGMLILVFGLTLTINKNYLSERGWMTASFLTMIVSVLFRFMGILSDKAMFGSFALFILTLVWIKMKD